MSGALLWMQITLAFNEMIRCKGQINTFHYTQEQAIFGGIIVTRVPGFNLMNELSFYVT